MTIKFISLQYTNINFIFNCLQVIKKIKSIYLIKNSQFEQITFNNHCDLIHTYRLRMSHYILFDIAFSITKLKLLIIYLFEMNYICSS